VGKEYTETNKYWLGDLLDEVLYASEVMEIRMGNIVSDEESGNGGGRRGERGDRSRDVRE
jgi:hypothetical protein